MSSPSEQHPAPSSRWWVRLCQWLWSKRGFIWGTLIAGIGLNWLTSTSIFTGTPLGIGLLWMRDHLLLAGLSGVCLLFLTLLVGVVSHLAGPSTRPATTASEHQQSRIALIRLLRHEYRRQLAESLQGHARMALALLVRERVRSCESWQVNSLSELSRMQHTLSR
jgi:hypothetical protein